MNQRLGRAGLILVMIACSFLNARAQYAHPDLKSGKIVLHKVLVLPPRATVTKSGMKGNETLIAESGMLEAALPVIVAQAVGSPWAMKSPTSPPVRLPMHWSSCGPGAS